jgi:hypothetical protein
MRTSATKNKILLTLLGGLVATLNIEPSKSLASGPCFNIATKKCFYNKQTKLFYCQASNGVLIKINYYYAYCYGNTSNGFTDIAYYQTPHGCIGTYSWVNVCTSRSYGPIHLTHGYVYSYGCRGGYCGSSQ